VLAVLVLCAWWARHVLRTRRNRAASTRPPDTDEASGHLTGSADDAEREPADTSLTRTET